MGEMIRVENLVKKYDEFTALENISFKIDRNDVLLILGPNGSGKTTLLRCILGLLRFSGRITLGNIDITKDIKRVKRLIGYVPQSINFPRNMTAREILNLHDKLHEIEINEEELISSFGLGDVVDVPVGEYSGGMRQRLALCVAIAHDPEILIFDEPLANLDFEGRKIFLRLLNELRKREKTILISSHKIVDILLYIDKILMLSEGRQLYFGPLERLVDRLRSMRFYLRLNTSIDRLQLKSGRIITHNNQWLLVETHNIVETIGELIRKHVDIGSIYVEEPSLDELIGYLHGDNDHE